MGTVQISVHSETDLTKHLVPIVCTGAGSVARAQSSCLEQGKGPQNRAKQVSLPSSQTTGVADATLIELFDTHSAQMKYSQAVFSTVNAKKGLGIKIRIAQSTDFNASIFHH